MFEPPAVLTIADAAKELRCSKAHLAKVLNGQVPGVPDLPHLRSGAASSFPKQHTMMFLLKCRNPKVFGDRREDTVQLDGQLSVVDILRSRRQRRLAREAAEEARTFRTRTQ